LVYTFTTFADPPSSLRVYRFTAGSGRIVL
jgi:hypothetical protein